MNALHPGHDVDRLGTRSPLARASCAPPEPDATAGTSTASRPRDGPYTGTVRRRMSVGFVRWRRPLPAPARSPRRRDRGWIRRPPSGQGAGPVRGSTSRSSIATTTTCSSRSATRSRPGRSRPERSRSLCGTCSAGASACGCCSERSRDLDLGTGGSSSRTRRAERTRLGYDQLIVAAGSDYSYFGHEQWRAVALEVKSLDSALEVRGRILHAFEEAELKPPARRLADVPDRRRRPDRRRDGRPDRGTGAGDAAGRVPVDRHPPRTGAAGGDGRQGALGVSGPAACRAAKSLEQLGVTLVLGHQVVDIAASSVTIQDQLGAGNVIPTRTVVWAAGVTASPLAGARRRERRELDRDGRLEVEPDLSLTATPRCSRSGTW